MCVANCLKANSLTELELQEVSDNGRWDMVCTTFPISESRDRTSHSIETDKSEGPAAKEGEYSFLFEFKLLASFKKKTQNNSLEFVKSPNNHLLSLKGDYAVLFFSIKKKNFYIFKKVAYKFLRNLKKINSLCYSLLGVLGRGMSLAVWKRSFLLDGVGNIKKRIRRNARHAFLRNCFPTLKKNKNKKLRKKKKVYTKQVSDLNKLFRKRKVINNIITRLGERGHVVLRRPHKSFFTYRKKNTLYKVLAFVTTALNKNDLLIATRRIIKNKPFGPYKVKGLKKLAQSGILLEGKSRKL